MINTEERLTGASTRDPDMVFPAGGSLADIEAAAAATTDRLLDASRLATRLPGDAIGANLMLVGFAWQKGWLPLSAEAILRAIEINVR
ncbi:MAG: hypothetical protein R3D25_12350 [Geminicoccaceae bacterium]